MHLFDHIVVIDPGTRVAETDSFNHIARWSSLPCTYHLPILSGSDTFEEESLDHVKAIVILGGSGNMYDDLAWRNELETWFKKAMDQKIPTLGICWGHQWIAHLFGGEIGDAHDGGEAHGSGDNE